MRHVLLAGAACACLGLASAAVAADGVAPGNGDDATGSAMLQRTLYKTASYQTLSSVDDFIFGYLFGGGIAAGGMLVLANGVTETAVNYAHDLSWAVASQDLGLSEADTRTARTASYTAVNTIRVFGLGLLFTGSAAVSLGYVAINAAADAAVYAANDVVWEKLWPPPDPSLHPSRGSRWLALGDYLPDVRVTIREAPATSTMSIRVVPSQDGSLIRVVRLPAN